MPAPREPNTVQPWDRPCLHGGLAWNHAMMTKDGLIFEANSLKQGRLQALTRQQLQAQATQNRERRWVAVLIILLLARARRGPSVLFQIQTPGRSGSGSAAWLSALFAAAVMPSYVLYGFDTAGTLVEETHDPRRRAPWAILRAISAAGLAGALLIIAGLLALSDPAMPEFGEITGGLPLIIKQSLGPELGKVFLGVVIFAVTECALAVQAGTVRLIFAMARDNSLPCARILARVQHV